LNSLREGSILNLIMNTSFSRCVWKRISKSRRCLIWTYNFIITQYLVHYLLIFYLFERLLCILNCEQIFFLQILKRSIPSFCLQIKWLLLMWSLRRKRGLSLISLLLWSRVVRFFFLLWDFLIFLTLPFKHVLSISFQLLRGGIDIGRKG